MEYLVLCSTNKWIQSKVLAIGYTQKIDENPYEDLNTLIEQSSRLYYSNRIYIALLGNPLDMPLASVSKSLINT